MKEIELKQPDKTRGFSVMKALELRKSDRDFSDKMLNDQDLSDLLWAANGVNRPETGHRTAPSAMNKQDIDLYVCMATGAYHYQAKEHKLVLVTKEDVRKWVAGGQDFVLQAPVSIVMVSDASLFQGNDETKMILGAFDAGIVSQNIALFCSATGLLTVPRRYMDMEGNLHKALQLRPEQILMLNNPVGYPK